MKQRCLNEKSHNYYKYGGRGIQVCARWLESFENFYADMGPRPSPEHSVDRIDNSGNYEPNNCRWATDDVQARNHRNNAIIEMNGQRKCVAEWSEITGIRANTIVTRIRRGWSPQEAISIPGKQSTGFRRKTWYERRIRKTSDASPRG
jgi:hypothetical protein